MSVLQRKNFGRIDSRRKTIKSRSYFYPKLNHCKRRNQIGATSSRRRSYWMFQNSVSQPPGRVPVPGLEDLFTGTWNIRETKNPSEITKKSCILRSKSLEKSIPGTIGHKTISYRDKRQKKIILPGLGLKKVENHCSRAVVLNLGCA